MNDLSIRPIYHRNEDRIEAHIVLATTRGLGLRSPSSVTFVSVMNSGPLFSASPAGNEQWGNDLLNLG